jgi:hypothetical protein
MMVEQQLRRVTSMNRGIGRESIGPAHAHTSATSSWSRSLRGLMRIVFHVQPRRSSRSLNLVRYANRLYGFRGVPIFGTMRKRFALRLGTPFIPANMSLNAAWQR